MAAPTNLRDTRVKRFSPMGLSDSLDATDEFPGACLKLANLVPDFTTRNVWACRPAASLILSTVGRVSVCKVIGNIVYGLVQSAGGTDAPFAFNLASNTSVSVTGTGQHPTSGSSFFDVVPPTMDLVGVFLIVTHQGFSGTNFFGWFNISTPSAPVWNSGDLTAGGAFTFTSIGSKPAWVCQFNARAYFGVNGITQPGVFATDPLTLKITNASQSLTFGDNVPLTIAAPLGLSNQLGGIIQSLMVFKDTRNIYQITGDFATTNLSINTLNVATGIIGVRALCSTPVGLAFISPHGMRIIDPDGNVSAPVGNAGTGITVPLSTILASIASPESVCMGCDGITIKIALVNFTGSEYWYNIPRKCWSGPHTPFTSIQFDIFKGAFISVPYANSIGGGIFGIYSTPVDQPYSFSLIEPSTFVELGEALTFIYQTTTLEDNEQMATSELSEMQIVTGTGTFNPATFTVNLLDPVGNTFNTSHYTVPLLASVAVVPYGGMIPYKVDFPSLSVFNRLSVQITGNSDFWVRLGDIWMRTKTLGYVPATQT